MLIIPRAVHTIGIIARAVSRNFAIMKMSKHKSNTIIADTFLSHSNPFRWEIIRSSKTRKVFLYIL